MKQAHSGDSTVVDCISSHLALGAAVDKATPRVLDTAASLQRPHTDLPQWRPRTPRSRGCRP